MTREQALEAALRDARPVVRVVLGTSGDSFDTGLLEKIDAALALPPPVAGAEPTPVALETTQEERDWIFGQVTDDDVQAGSDPRPGERPFKGDVRSNVTRITQALGRDFETLINALTSARAAGAEEAEKRIVAFMRRTADEYGSGSTVSCAFHTAADAIERGQHK